MREFQWNEATIRSIDRTDVFVEAPAPNPPLAALGPSLRKHWRSIVAITALTLAAAGAYLVLASPQFTASALVLIDTKSNANLRNAPTLTDANVESANIESQVEILKSERIMRRVVESENLADDPALMGGPVERAIAEVMDRVKFWKRPIPTMPGEDPKVIAAARALQKLTSAKRLGLTYVVEISTILPDPVQAARVTNAYAAAYIDDQMRLREETARRLSKMLQERTDELQSQAQKAERAVEQLKFSGSLEGESSASARVTLKNLESSAQTYRVLHDKFLERYAETWQQQFLSLPDAQVASAAYPPLSKSSPKTLLILAASLFIGIALGVLRAIILERHAMGLRA
ncbi:Wzz/FepE/Etk N-terminal domain-containing protein [Methylobacterium nigriterrae]|uniref:Wzz/FepE/Etk N-terminal domain-containing protein n=1 Tax=Methylobacterium nigriterrae TaxID=3127512 RepID=UPI003013B504